MNASGEHGPQTAGKQAGRRGGVWPIGEVLSELLPRYAPLPTDRAETAAPVNAGWNLLQAELVSCS